MLTRSDSRLKYSVIQIATIARINDAKLAINEIKLNIEIMSVEACAFCLAQVYKYSESHSTRISICKEHQPRIAIKLIAVVALHASFCNRAARDARAFEAARFVLRAFGPRT